MLDFYLIPEREETPDNPAQIQLEFIGQLDEKTFTQLKIKKIIPDRDCKVNCVNSSTIELK